MLAAKGASGFRDQDDVVFIPFNTGQVRLFGARPTSIRSSRPGRRRRPDRDASRQQITDLLRQRHRLTDQAANDFNVRNNNQIRRRSRASTQTMT